MTKQELEQCIKAEKTAALVVNTHARKGERLFAQAQNYLTTRGISLIASSPVKDPSRLPDVIKDLVHRGCKFIIVGGGDGTVSSIVDALAYQDVVLGLLPLGTGNSFARTLGLPLSLQGAIEVVVQGKVADIDLSKVDGDYFANVASLRGRMAPSGARPSTGPGKRSAPRAGQRLVGVVASHWRPQARSLRGRDRRS